mgnify:CR=1 FL=1
MSTNLLVVALEDEYPTSLSRSNCGLIHTGVGKVNATLTLTKALSTWREPNLPNVINYGTAGSVNNKHTGLVEVDVLIQRDMITEPLSPRGIVPYDTSEYCGAIMLNSNTNITCGTGDSFVTEKDPWFDYSNVDIVDMEAYGIAKICAKEQIDFECYKFITDFADEDAMKDWQLNQANGAEAFLDIVK